MFDPAPFSAHNESVRTNDNHEHKGQRTMSNEFHNGYAAISERHVQDCFRFIGFNGLSLDTTSQEIDDCRRRSAFDNQKKAKKDGHDLTDGERELLQVMRDHCEGYRQDREDGTVWADVYLDNVPLRFDNPRRFAGLCGSLAKKGYFEPMDVAFGTFRLLD